MKFVSAIALSGLLLAGCASVAHVEKDDNVNLANYHSYAWAEAKEAKNDSAKTKVSDLTERTIKKAVNAELANAVCK
jgi:outer membrane murein-binding lipoprotein Lpp